MGWRHIAEVFSALIRWRTEEKEKQSDERQLYQQMTIYLKTIKGLKLFDCKRA